MHHLTWIRIGESSDKTGSIKFEVINLLIDYSVVKLMNKKPYKTCFN